MRRVVPQKVQPAADQSYSGELPTEISKPGNPGGARRARTSAAMIGLAISMGASGLLIPRHDGRAVAAEPQTAEAESAPVPVDSSDLLQPAAASDEITRSESVGEVTGSLSTDSPSSNALEKAEGVSPEGSFEQLRMDRDTSLERLRYQRSQLQQSLSGSRVAPESVEVPEANIPKAIAPDTTPEMLPPELSGTVLYRVKPGDTIDSIARDHGVSRQTLISLNDLQNPDFLRVHQAIRVPQVSQEAQLPHGFVNVSAPTAEPEAQLPQVVRPSVVAATVSPAPRSTVHRVAPGETVAAIARAYGVSSAALITENRLTNPNRIWAGQELHIPGGTRVEQSASLPLTIAYNPEGASSAEPLTKDSGFEASVPEVAALPSGALENLSRPEPIVSSNSAVFSTEFIAVESSTPEVSGVVPPIEALQASTVPAVGGSNLYAAQLASEVSDLQTRYSSERVEVPSAAQQPTLIASSFVGRRSNSVASSDQQRVAAVAPTTAPEVIDAQLSTEELQERATERKPDAVATDSATEPQVVAAAPIGSENYAPLLEPIVGRMVAPELPPLPAADAFLPQGSNIFAGYAWPARGVLTSGYGPRWGRMHRGIDIAAPVGTPVYAAAPGVIEYAGWNSGGYGYMVDIRHPDGSMTRYAHNSRLLVQRGQEVAQGDQISEMGSTGYSTGPHLHFEIHMPERGAVNPMTMLAAR
ncbi:MULTISPECIES: peptidoglycan DD-metalloendopeptidase family protein [unclassified Leptolyngbya]|uniref:peptidoglycan DD-metalloendopeptidase family protein n=1 Tax=unclassified Leptolyngbya TaxID=2650499 RepID=UPI0016852F01|nr:MULTISPECIES: peptidoglycan DD-metalloendopeptidase family protein [unclassified Leptolyngbya]MBD1909708.1 peptidoglycan DD-metalloendopeptidase family protein [Leptolyngbya sp. FACHB-8]MBD2155974.1 peptidoglycan DD-metalloendopeptidase family protein [Leptolyngbya sp. FACHB-16]